MAFHDVVHSTLRACISDAARPPFALLLTHCTVSWLVATAHGLTSACRLQVYISLTLILNGAAAVCVGKIAEQLELHGRFLNTKTIASVFFVIDIICIGVQGAGSAIISSTLQNSGKASSTGTTIVLIGLAIQLFFFANFAAVTAYVYYLQRRKAVNKVPDELYIGLTATILLITMRNAYRVVEIAVSAVCILPLS